MYPKFSKFKSQVSLLLKANVPIPTIATTLHKSKRSLYNAILRIIQKKQENTLLKRVKLGRVFKLTKKEERRIKRDLVKDPKKTRKSFIVKNKLNISKRSL